MESHSGTHRVRSRIHSDRQHARVRYRAQPIEPSDGFRRRRAARAHPHQPARRDAGARASPGRVPQSRGSRARAGVPRSGARLRLLPLRPERAAIHEADRAQARAGSGADRPRHPRRRQRRRRAALDSRRHDRAARPPGAELRPRQLQRLQHLLSASRVGHVGRLVGLSRRRYRRPRRRAERRRQLAGGVELLSAARPRGGRARGDPAGRARAARHAANGVRPQAVRRVAAPRVDARYRSARARSVSAADRAARRRAGDSRLGRLEGARARRYRH